MAAIRWFRVPIRVGDWARDLYLYETHVGLFDLQFHFQYTTNMHDSLADTLKQFAMKFTEHHQLHERNLQLVIGETTEVSWDDVQANKPRNQPVDYFDPP